LQTLLIAIFLRTTDLPAFAFHFAAALTAIDYGGFMGHWILWTENFLAHQNHLLCMKN